MSDTQRGLARWRYWAARAAERNDDPKLARQLYESTLTDDNFYSIAAAARLGPTLAPHPERLVVDEVQLKQIEQLPALVRARELFRCDMRDLASPEWAYGYEMLPQTARPQAVQLASRWGWHDQAIATAAQQRLFNDYALLYPQPFDRQVRAAAQLSELPPELIYSVMRQESLYRSDAISSAGARGLLQMVPDTARRTARAWKRPRPTPDDSVRSERRCRARRCALAQADRSLRRPDDRGARGLQRRPERRRALDSAAARRSRTCGSRTSRTTRRAPTCSASSGTTSCSTG